jgi:hypothetical protein|tara:strand:- start:1342 stop:3258 length:1917 start_codon:yes stop_codon:yes gene_type:complete
MALLSETLTYTVTAGTGNKAIALDNAIWGGASGKVAKFWCNGDTADGISTHAQLGMGVAISTTSRVAVAVVSEDAQGTSDASRRHDSTKCIILLDNNGAVVFAADFVSFTADTLTINVTTAVTGLLLNIQVDGGDDLENVHIKEISTPASTGSVAYTGIGFNPDVLSQFGVGIEMDFTQGVAAGASGQSLSFDGVDDAVQGNSSDFAFGSGDFSISAWAATANTGNVDNKIFAYRRTGSLQVFQLRRGNSSGDGGTQVLLQTNTGAWNTAYTDAAVFDDTDWHHVVAVKSGTGVTFYVDGSAVASSGSVHATLGASDDDAWEIGSRPGSTDFWNGLLDDVRIYDDALTADEVAFIFEDHTGTPSVPADDPGTGNLVSLWKLDGDLTDETANANDGVFSTQPDAIFSLGHSDATDNFCVSSASDDGAATSDAERAQVTSDFLHAGWTFGSGAPDATAVTSLDSDGFTLPWATADATIRRAVVLSIKGPQVKVITDTQPTTISSKSTDIGFPGVAGLLTTFMDVASASVEDDARIGIGGLDSSGNQAFAGAVDEDGQGTTDADRVQDSNEVLLMIDHAQNVDARATGSFSGNNLALNWTAADAVARQWGGLVLGSAAAGNMRLVNGGLINRGLVNAGLSG